MILLSVIHDQTTRTLEATWADDSPEPKQGKCRSYSPPQKADFLADTGSEGLQYVEEAGWTDQFVADWIAAEEAAAAPTPEQLAAQAAQEALIAAKAEAKADNIVQYLRDHTPAECAQYVQANVTDLASAKAFLKKVAIVLCVLSKESLR